VDEKSFSESESGIQGFWRTNVRPYLEAVYRAVNPFRQKLVEGTALEGQDLSYTLYNEQGEPEVITFPGSVGITAAANDNSVVDPLTGQNLDFTQDNTDINGTNG
jgi:hypothetical protein